jgi:dTDP-4-dehydrorhamnose reductase
LGIGYGAANQSWNTFSHCSPRPPKLFVRKNLHGERMSNMPQATNSQDPELELWGGVECTVNRINEIYYDQLKLSGHDHRALDIRIFAELGIQAIRYPVLWERIVKDQRGVPDWSWSDERLELLRAAGIRPILGLLHHGSGPMDTSLVAPDFARKFAQYAVAVATRYPWIEYYTPINEPLTTARFSGLYGHWYPHERSDRAFTQALLNQCRAIVLAMRAIREINPGAKLIQTENLEKVHSTPELRYQADFENERRWLSIDLITGRVNRDHPLWSYLLFAGVQPRELDWFAEHAEPPAILGWNYYLTSERFLDHRKAHYPASAHGGNGRDEYADVEAVRVRGEGVVGLKALLREAWERYQLPLAVTESHVGDNRESQLRWLADAWNDGCALRREGVDVRAITAWSLLGSFDWNTLCTQRSGFYESGIFDVRAGAPRATALATFIKHLSRGENLEHVAVPQIGWWEKEQRLTYPAVFTTGHRTVTRTRIDNVRQQTSLLITGATGTLGQAFAFCCQKRGLSHVVLSRAEMDITSIESIETAIKLHRPWGVVNTAGYVRVDDAETDAECCRMTNTAGPLNLAHICSRDGLKMVTFSSDLVFDGTRGSPYVEHDSVRPLSVYGMSKADAEREVLSAYPATLVVRTSAFFGPWDQHNFLTISMRRLAAGLSVCAPEDWIVSPTYVPDLVNACLDLLIDDEHGLWHLANEGMTSWADFVRMGAAEAGLDPGQVLGCTGRELGLRAQRPSFSALGSERGVLLPTLASSVRRYWQDCQHTTMGI